MKSPALPQALVALVFLSLAGALASGRFHGKEELRDALGSLSAAEGGMPHDNGDGILERESPSVPLTEMSGGVPGAKPQNPSKGKSLRKISLLGVKPDSKLELVEIKGVKIDRGDGRKPKKGGEQQGGSGNIEDPCPSIVSPILVLSQLPQLPRRPLGEASRLDRDAYKADALKFDMNKLQSLVDLCRAGHMRAIAEHIGSIRGSTVLRKGEVMPAAGAVDKADADGLMNSSLQLVYKYDPHLDPKDQRTMDPYK